MRSNTGLVVEEPVTSCTSPKATNSSAPRATTKGVERPVARDPAAVTAPVCVSYTAMLPSVSSTHLAPSYAAPPTSSIAPSQFTIVA